MLFQFLPARLTRLLTRAFLVSYITLNLIHAQASDAPNVATGCRIEAVNYEGWSAQQMSNRWVQLIIVPQNGGRFMQVTFAGHAFLFVNPKYAGKYMPPAPDKWFNYGGDKLWPLPEGNNDEQHWAGASDVLDDGPGPCSQSRNTMRPTQGLSKLSITNFGPLRRRTFQAVI
ncbi:MAG: hypothetical protein DMG95_12590 [Acidobacteria bacterium]|nr:MAG: hypothetical protein DMG95_12590 [Acidobacteriota bacterium]